LCRRGETAINTEIEILYCVSSGDAQRWKNEEETAKNRLVSKYFNILISLILKFADLIILLASSGTRAAVCNTRDHAKNNVCTERGRTCNICVTPSLLLWKLPDSLADGYDCWGIQQLEHHGEPLKVLMLSPALL